MANVFYLTFLTVFYSCHVFLRFLTFFIFSGTFFYIYAPDTMRHTYRRCSGSSIFSKGVNMQKNWLASRDAASYMYKRPIQSGTVRPCVCRQINSCPFAQHDLSQQKTSALRSFAASVRFETRKPSCRYGRCATAYAVPVAVLTFKVISPMIFISPERAQTYVTAY